MKILYVFEVQSLKTQNIDNEISQNSSQNKIQLQNTPFSSSPVFLALQTENFSASQLLVFFFILELFNSTGRLTYF